MIAFLRNVGIFGTDIIELNYVHNYLVVGNLPMDIGIYGLLAFGLNTSIAINTSLNRFNLHDF